MFEFLAGSTSTGALVFALVAGTIGGLLAGLTPGINGRVGLMLATPIALGLGMIPGAVFLVAFHSVVHTSGSVPAILLGMPTSVTEAATVIDGYAMTRKGEGARAIGITVGSSMVGGVIGALVLLGLAPVALAAARYFGAPEMAALSLLGLLSIAALSGGSMAGGLMSAALGVLIAAVGLDMFSGVPRFTFGSLELLDGVNAAAVVTGMFIVPEMVLRPGAGAAPTHTATQLDAVWAGVLQTLNHRWLLLRASLLGALVGMVPGLGASVAVWLAYGHARQTEPSDTPYGEGAAAGIIAPEAANNSKEGGALAPALFFGVPSSSGMGILLAAFIVLGVEVGPRMLARDPGFVYLMGLTNIASNILAVPVCILLAPVMARFAFIRAEIVGPAALAAGVAAAALTAPGPETLGMIALFSLLGLVLKGADIPRAPLLLGFVLAPNLESGVVRSVMVHGWSALSRPGVLTILVIAVAIALPMILRRRAKETEVAKPETRTPFRPFAIALLAMILLTAILGLAGAPLTARLLPTSAAAIGLGAAGLTAWRLWAIRRIEPSPAPAFDLRLLGLLVTMLGLSIWAGLPIAVALFIFATLRLGAKVSYPVAMITSAFVSSGIYLLEILGQ